MTMTKLSRRLLLFGPPAVVAAASLMRVKPFPAIPAPRPWTPADIPGLVHWWDAKTGTIVGSRRNGAPIGTLIQARSTGAIMYDRVLTSDEAATLNRWLDTSGERTLGFFVGERGPSYVDAL
jgi:hypothetical protein